VRLPVLRQSGTERAVGAPDEVDDDGKNTDGRVEVSTDSRKYCNVIQSEYVMQPLHRRTTEQIGWNNL